MRRLIAVLVATTLSGCATVQTQSGNSSPFLSRVLSEHGATLSHVDVASIIEAQWEYRPDEYGFVLDVAGDSFSKVDAFLRTYFGEPDIWVEANLEGHPQGLFGLEQTEGVVIQYVETDAGTRVVCVKKQEGPTKQSTRTKK